MLLPGKARMCGDACAPGAWWGRGSARRWRASPRYVSDARNPSFRRCVTPTGTRAVFAAPVADPRPPCCHHECLVLRIRRARNVARGCVPCCLRMPADVSPVRRRGWRGGALERTVRRAASALGLERRSRQRSPAQAFLTLVHVIVHTVAGTPCWAPPSMRRPGPLRASGSHTESERQVDPRPGSTRCRTPAMPSDPRSAC